MTAARRASIVKPVKTPIGSRKDRKLYDLDNNLICALVPISSFQSMVEGQALVRFQQLAGWS